MKKIAFSLMAACMLLLFVPTQLKAANENGAVAVEAIKASPIDATNASETINTLAVTDYDADIARLEEIKAMNLSSLSSSEKNELREEVKMIKKDMESLDNNMNKDKVNRKDGGVIYISAGTVLLILILILLLA